MIRINLVREGRAAVRGTAAAPVAVTGPSNLGNQLLVGLIVLGLLAAGGYWFLKKRELQAIEQQVQEKRREAESLERIIREVEEFKRRKDSLEQRIALINELKRNQKVPVRVMDQVSRDLPDLVWLDRMVLTGTRIQIEGRALNENAVALYITNLKANPLFDEPIVRSIELRGTNVYAFSMSFNFRYETLPASSGDEGEPAGSEQQPAG